MWHDLEPGETGLVHAALAEPDEGDSSDITVLAVEPQIVEGDLAVEVLACHRRPDRPGIGSVSGDVLDQYCETHGPAVGARLDADSRLIYRFRSEEPGSVVIDGIKVTYSHGWRRGSQLTGTRVDFAFCRRSRERVQRLGRRRNTVARSWPGSVGSGVG